MALKRKIKEQVEIKVDQIKKKQIIKPKAAIQGDKEIKPRRLERRRSKSDKNLFTSDRKLDVKISRQGTLLEMASIL
jgi:hypothetical protein